MKKCKLNIKSKCSRKNGNVKHNLPNSSNDKVSTNRKNLTTFFTKKINKSESTKKDNTNWKREGTGTWLKESSPKKGNWLSMRNYSRKRKGKRPKEYWQDSETRALNWLPTKGNLTDLLKSKGSRRKENNKKTGKREKRPESICCIKCTMTEKERSGNTKRRKKKNWEKRNRTSLKSKKESANTNPSNKLVIRLNMKCQSMSKRNCCKRSQKSKREED